MTLEINRTVIVTIYPVTVLLLAIILEKYIIRKSKNEHKQVSRFIIWMLVSMLLLFYILVNSKYSTVVDMIL